ncbi:MAG: hypothetical protein II849_08375 [Bacteroidales bacterium]|nr:hypothetical protein [Bacteroidales bacterium]
MEMCSTGSAFAADLMEMEEKSGERGVGCGAPEGTGCWTAGAGGCWGAGAGGCWTTGGSAAASLGSGCCGTGGFSVPASRPLAIYV